MAIEKMADHQAMTIGAASRRVLDAGFAALGIAI